MTSICASMLANCRIGALTLEAVERCVRLALSASWGSWCSLGQTHERARVDGTRTKAKICIYLKGLPVGSRYLSSPAASKVVPNDGSRWTGMMTAPVAAQTGSADSAVRLKAL